MGGGPLCYVRPMQTHEAITLYLAARDGELGARTLKQTRGTLRMLPDLPLTEHTEQTLRKWRAALLARGLDPDSASTYFNRVRGFFQYARRQQWIPVDPTADIGRLLPNPKRKLRLSLPQVQDAILRARHPRDRAMLFLASELLLRASELALLKVGDIRWDDNMLDVYIMKKRGIFVHDEMPISASLARELRNWLGAYAQTAGILRRDFFLFPRMDTRYSGRDRKYWISPAEPIAHPAEVVKLALDSIGVTEGRRGFHDVRRSMARLRYDDLFDRGVPDPLGVVKALLHHEKRKQTEQYIGIDAARSTRNKVMRSDNWLSVLPATAECDNDGDTGLAQVIPLTP